MPDALDAPTLRRAMGLYAQALHAHREEIDSLNVFPVPDGDTGSNLLRTHEEVGRALSADPRADLQATCGVIARASLTGARGSSGVILALALRGLCGSVASAAEPGPAALATALAEASSQARRGVADPLEGTVLTVLRDAAGAARDAAHGGADLAAVASAALEEGRASLARTREALPALRAAGVVDAGAKGIVVLLDAIVAAVTGGPLSEPIGPLGPAGVGVRVDRPHPDGLGFEVQALLEADDATAASLRTALAGLGDSLAVAGGGGLYRLHVHTSRPEEAMRIVRAAGRVIEAEVVDLTEAVARCATGIA